MKVMNANDFFSNVPALKREWVDLSEFGEGSGCYVSEMLALEQDKFEIEVTKRRENARARLVVLCATDEAGKKLFQRTDAPRLGQLPGSVLKRLFDACARVNAYTETDMDELEKNSEETISADSPSS